MDRESWACPAADAAADFDWIDNSDAAAVAAISCATWIVYNYSADYDAADSADDADSF